MRLETGFDLNLMVMVINGVTARVVFFPWLIPWFHVPTSLLWTTWQCTMLSIYLVYMEFVCVISEYFDQKFSALENAILSRLDLLLEERQSSSELNAGSSRAQTTPPSKTVRVSITSDIHFGLKFWSLSFFWRTGAPSKKCCPRESVFPVVG